MRNKFLEGLDMSRLIKENEVKYYEAKVKREKQIRGKRLMYSNKK